MSAAKRDRDIKGSGVRHDNVEAPSNDQHQLIRVLIVEAAGILAQTLPIALAADPGLQIEAVLSDADTVLEYLAHIRPDVVLLSDSLPDTDMASLVSEVHAAAPSTKILILSEAANDELLSKCVCAGASGYMTWQQSPTELRQGIRRVHADDTLIDNHVLLRLVQSSRQTLQRPRSTANLAPREIDVLRYVMVGLRNDEIARELGISVHTVRAHLHSAMSKLHVHSRLEAAIAALKAGLVRLPKGLIDE
jgi:DNA-binding NarL/FixJ family response regulator